MVLLDIVLGVVAYFVANLIRFEGAIPPRDWAFIGRTLPNLIVIRFLCFTVFGLYRGIWTYASINDLINVAKASIVGSLALWVVVSRVLGMPGHSRGVLVADWLLVLLLIGGSRLWLRLWRELFRSKPSGAQPVLIIGAGGAGERIVRDLLRDPKLRYQPIGYLDDAPERRGGRIHGVPVLGSIQEVERIAQARRASQVIIAIPSASCATRRRIFELCSAAGLAMKIVPGTGQLLNGTARASLVRDVRLEDLLRREPLHLDAVAVRSYLHGRSVLVTGAGGSIGSEICRQVAAQEPEFLVLLDKSENALFEIDTELGERFPRTKRGALLVDIKHRHKLDEVFGRYRPGVVFNAAAYKHVPLMEGHIDEAVLNNVVGTRNLVEVAVAHRTAAFVLISTDKAVNPASVMGATKRVAERYLQTMAADPARGETVLCAVRFGNVLGSSGSVVPLFKKQIERGGPITITHPDMTRYFMTIPEAVQLVLRATTLARDGEIFVLDMGEPIRIADMARDLVRLSGLEPGQDIDIVFTGVRPGERLKEELWNGAEDMEPTAQDKLMVVRRRGSDGPDLSMLLSQLSEMEALAKAAETHDLVRALRRAVPEYQPSTAPAHPSRGDRAEASRGLVDGPIAP